MPDYRPVKLFGGAMVVNLPVGYTDVSEFRQVPDNQEVYLDVNGFTSITFDITERVDAVSTDEAALKFHLEDIVEEDEVKIWSETRVCMEHLQDRPTYTVFATREFPREIAGTHIPGFNRTPVFTALLMTLVRLEAQKTDIVVTINVPHIKGDYSEEHIHLENGQLGPLLDTAILFRDEILKSFEIKDWNLFV